MTYFVSSSLTNVPLNEDFCTAFIVLCARLLLRYVHSSETYRQKCYTAVLTMRDEVDCHTSAASLFLPELPHIRIFVQETTKMVSAQNCTAGSLRTFFCPKPETKPAQAERLQAFRVPLAATALFS